MTFSIVSRCSETGMFGLAISSSSPAVAARCAYARARVGAVASQNITDQDTTNRGIINQGITNQGTQKETVVSGWSSEQRSEDTLHHRDQEPLSKSDLVAALPGEDDSEL